MKLYRISNYLYLTFVYKIIPVPILLLHAKYFRLQGLALFNFICLSNHLDLNSIDTKALIVHESTHVKQFYRTLGLSTLLYRLFNHVWYQYEIEAYANQIKYLLKEDNTYTRENLVNITVDLLSNYMAYNFILSGLRRDIIKQDILRLI